MEKTAGASWLLLAETCAVLNRSIVVGSCGSVTKHAVGSFFTSNLAEEGPCFVDELPRTCCAAWCQTRLATSSRGILALSAEQDSHRGPTEPGNVGAFILRIEFWGILSHNEILEHPPKPCSGYQGGPIASKPGSRSLVEARGLSASGQCKSLFRYQFDGYRRFRVF